MLFQDLRRLLLLWLLMFWQGGFIFYGTVVVTIGTEVLGSALEQGWITQRVTNWLNVAGAVTMAAWAWDIAVAPASRSLRRQCWLALLFLAVTLVLLAWLHLRMDRYLDSENSVLTDEPAFRHLHRWYLRISTAQWVGSVVLSWWTLRIWRQTYSPAVVD